MTQYYNQQQPYQQQPYQQPYQQQAQPQPSAQANYNWNSALPDKPRVERVLVPDGRYAFQVKSKNFTYWESGKLAGFPKCEIVLQVWNESGTQAEVSANLTLADSMVFVVRQFWSAVGENVQPNVPFAPPWGTIQGRQGWLELSHRSYVSTRDNQQKTVNEVKRYLEPDGRPLPPMPQQTQQEQPQQHEQTQYDQQVQPGGELPF